MPIRATESAGLHHPASVVIVKHFSLLCQSFLKHSSVDSIRFQNTLRNDSHRRVGAERSENSSTNLSRSFRDVVLEPLDHRIIPVIY